jgi:hypothetical protein
MFAEGRGHIAGAALGELGAETYNELLLQHAGPVQALDAWWQCHEAVARAD